MPSELRLRRRERRLEVALAVVAPLPLLCESALDGLGMATANDLIVVVDRAVTLELKSRCEREA
jgi:hypothetical protein